MITTRIHTIWALGLFLVGAASAPVQAQVQEYGDEDLSNTGTYSSDPKAGATLLGLSPNTVTFATNSFSHGFSSALAPQPGDFAGTDQIYVGSVQTGTHDGYSTEASRLHGPQTFTLNYGGLVPAGNTIQTLTLGLAADDFQAPSFGQLYSASINGVTNTALTNALNSLDLTGPRTQFLTVGVDPTLLNGSNALAFSINQGGDGGDGWSVDFLTVGVTSRPAVAATPEPGSIALFVGMGITGTGLLFRRRRRAATKTAEGTK